MSTTHRRLRAANINRDIEWLKAGKKKGVKFSLSFRGNELGGEAGEVQNILKKLDREAMGLPGSRSSPKKLFEELADVIICIDLIAMHFPEFDLATEVSKKFNKTSRQRKLKTKLDMEIL